MMAGVSAGASVKSKKLQQRNAILRSTGFIEEPARVKGVGGTSISCKLLSVIVHVTALACVVLHWRCCVAHMAVLFYRVLHLYVMMRIIWCYCVCR